MPSKMVVGDFNFPTINWSDLHCNSSNKEANAFKETVLECYMAQHVDFLTRLRVTDNPSCIDCIFTNSEELINNLLEISPLGNSDHTFVQVDINAKSSEIIQEILLRQMRLQCHEKVCEGRGGPSPWPSGHRPAMGLFHGHPTGGTRKIHT